MTDMTQGEFLRQAMHLLGLSKEDFADRIGTTLKSLNNWLLDPNTNSFRTMPAMAWKYIRDILVWESGQGGNLASPDAAGTCNNVQCLLQQKK